MESERGKGFIRSLLEWSKSLGTSLIILIVVLYFIQPTAVINSSMSPNFLEGDRLLLSTKSSINRGDVVVFNSGIEIGRIRWERLSSLQKLFIKPEDSMNLIKRVIGLPGEHFKLEEGIIYIDGEALKEDYANGTTRGQMDLLIPEGSYLVLGDNRENSFDSRDDGLGYIDGKDIRGKVFFRYWPLTRIKTIRGV